VQSGHEHHVGFAGSRHRSPEPDPHGQRLLGAVHVSACSRNSASWTRRRANLGFPTIKFMGADVVLDGGIGGFATTKTAYFLNTKYLYYRPHSKRNMVPLNPNRRYAVNQDAEVQILAFAGNMTCGAQFQGRLITP
jgi:hypothetical protein